MSSGCWYGSFPAVAPGTGPFRSVETYCMFIGNPKSGHSLVGFLLNAHNNAVISHELNALAYFVSIHKWPFCAISALREKNIPRNIN